MEDGLAITTPDITDRKRAEELQAQSRDELLPVAWLLMESLAHSSQKQA
jgi:hypothetical protein